MLAGFIGQDPKLKDVGSSKVVEFSVATDETYKDKKSGEYVNKSEWHNVKAWGKLAEMLANKYKKGSSIMLEGKITTESWDDKDGNKRSRTVILVNNVFRIPSKSSKSQDSSNDSSSDNGDDDGLF